MLAAKIADLAPADVDRVADILFEGFRELSPDWLPTRPVARAKVLDFLELDGFSRVVRDETGEIVGWCAGAHAYGCLWELHPLVVARRSRRQGYGRILIEDLERYVRDRGGLTIQLGTSDESNRTSIFGRDVYADIPGAIGNLHATPVHPLDFYRRIGFVVVGIVPDAEGSGKPSILMAKKVERG
jgi:aminoglycoside 6'-N-acetyltransferase I